MDLRKTENALALERVSVDGETRFSILSARSIQLASFENYSPAPLSAAGDSEPEVYNATMREIAVRARGLAKMYRIGGPQRGYRTLRETLMNAVTAPSRAAQSLFKKNGHRSKKDQPFWALRDVSFEINRGEVVGVIGCNGAGKSTLLKVLSRITEPTAGYAEIHGAVGSLLEVGSGFHPELTGRENIFLNGAILGMRRAEIERKFEEIVAFAEVEQFIETPVKHYSSGMYVRLAFGVAAHLEPDILIVDEVLAVGDFAFQRKCLGKMQSVARGGRTVLFVSHNMGAIKTLCNRCIFLEQGKVLADGPSESVVDLYIDKTNQAIRQHRPAKIEADRGEGFLLHQQVHCGELTISCGDPITLEFEIEAPNPISDRDAGVGVTLMSGTGVPIISMSSLVQKVSCTAGVSRLWRVRCEMGRLPINVGTYLATIYMGNEKGVFAQFNNAVTIRVLEHDVFGWGRSLPSSSYWGPIYWAPRWDIHPAVI